MLALAIAVLAAVLLTPYSNAQSDSDSGSYNVLASVAFVRTGERSPPQQLGRLPTALTSLGAQQAHNAGSFLRSRYVATSSSSSGAVRAPLRGLKVNSADPRQFYVLALDTQPTVTSAQAFVQGFYPPSVLNESTAALMDPTSVLANGTYIESPLDGYQYAQIRTASELDPEFVYVGGSLECPAFQVAALDYTSSPEFAEAQQSSSSFYESVGAASLADTLTESQRDFVNAYAIYDYLNFEATHNATVAAALTGQPSDGNSANITDLDRLRYLADAQQYAILGNLSAINNFTSPATGLPGSSEGSISTIAGNMLLAKILTQLQLAIETRGRYYKFSLLVGDFQPLMSLFAVTGLSDVNTQRFRSIPDFASMAVFELFTLSSSAVFPTSPDDLWVRFYFRNGTDQPEDGPALQSYPLFNHGPSETDMRWGDFVADASAIAMGSLGDWCQACGASTVFCPAFNESLFSAAAASEERSSSSRNHLSPSVAGILGAVIALIVAGLIFALAMLAGGVRLHRKQKAHAGAGGFQGDAKMPPDRDVEVSGGGADSKSGAMVVGREAPPEGGVGGSVVGGHERVGSWELKESGGGVRADPNRSRFSFEDDEDDRRAFDSRCISEDWGAENTATNWSLGCANGTKETVPFAHPAQRQRLSWACNGTFLEQRHFQEPSWALRRPRVMISSLRLRHNADTMLDYVAIYEQRLRTYLAVILTLEGLDVSPQWKKLLSEHDLEYWCAQVSGITLPQSKKLLAGIAAPTKGQMLTLPPIDGDYSPGVYYGLILTPNDPNSTFGYSGSATKAGFGLAGRTDQHKSSRFRANVAREYQNDGKSTPFYYRLVDQPGKHREEEVNSMRIVCLLAEQVYSSWLCTFTAESKRRFERSATLSPWSASEIRPTNWSQPILQGAHLAKGPSPLNPEEFRQRKVDMKWVLIDQETVEQRRARVLHQVAYNHVVHRPVELMRKALASEEKIRAFRKAANEQLFGLQSFALESEKREAWLSRKRNYTEEKRSELAGRREKRRKLHEENAQLQEAAAADMPFVPSEIETKANRSTTLILPFWGCMAKYADELTEDFGFRPREQFDRTMPPPQEGTGLWEH
ncbi:hypothetical protein Q7P37_007033 [Cladosporium fusiforme]